MSDFKFKEGDLVLCVLPEEVFEGKVVSRNYIMEDGETPTYRVQSVKHDTEITIPEDRMSYSPNYAISYIASAPEELKVGDRVEVVDEDNRFNGRQGIVSEVKPNGIVTVCFDKKNLVSYQSFVVASLRKLPDAISFLRKDNPILFEDDSDNVKAFKKILNEMAETYKAKNECYGNAYQDGFNRFGAVQLVSRIYEKYCRIENLLVRNADNKVPDESVFDSLTDLAVQSIVLRMLLEKECAF